MALATAGLSKSTRLRLILGVCYNLVLETLRISSVAAGLCADLVVKLLETTFVEVMALDIAMNKGAILNWANVS